MGFAPTLPTLKQCIRSKSQEIVVKTTELEQLTTKKIIGRFLNVFLISLGGLFWCFFIANPGIGILVHIL